MLGQGVHNPRQFRFRDCLGKIQLAVGPQDGKGIHPSPIGNGNHLGQDRQRSCFRPGADAGISGTHRAAGIYRAFSTLFGAGADRGFGSSAFRLILLRFLLVLGNRCCFLALAGARIGGTYRAVRIYRTLRALVVQPQTGVFSCPGMSLVANAPVGTKVSTRAAAVNKLNKRFVVLPPWISPWGDSQ